jgi:hypothetical protein
LKLNCYPAVHHFKEYPNAARVAEILEDAEVLGKRARNEPYRLARLHLWTESNNPGARGRNQKSFDYSSQDRQRVLTLHDKRRHPVSAIYGSPSVAPEVQHNEQIAREEWRKDGFKRTRVAQSSSVSW